MSDIVTAGVLSFIAGVLIAAVLMGDLVDIYATQKAGQALSCMADGNSVAQCKTILNLPTQ